MCWSHQTITAEAWRCSAQVKESHFGPPAPLQPLQPRRDQSGGPQIMAPQLSDQSITLVINIGKNICICIPRGNDIIIIKHNWMFLQRTFFAVSVFLCAAKKRYCWCPLWRGRGDADGNTLSHFYCVVWHTASITYISFIFYIILLTLHPFICVHRLL